MLSAQLPLQHFLKKHLTSNRYSGNMKIFHRKDAIHYGWRFLMESE